MSAHAAPARERRDDGGGDVKTQKMTMGDRATMTMMSPPKARFKMMFRSNSPRIAVKDDGEEEKENTTDMEM
jgi:hypothetical protein